MFGSWVLAAPLALIRWLFTPVPLAILALLMAWVYHFMTKNFDFWRRRGVSGPEPCFPWGNRLGAMFNNSPADIETYMYEHHGGKKFCGYFDLNRPILFVGDLDLIRDITIKDFESFTDRRDQGSNETLRVAVSVLRGAQWKETRSVMSPTFSASKLKAMHKLTLDNAHNLAHYVLEEMRQKGEVDMRDMAGRFTIDNIASCAFGVKCNSFTDPNNTFARNATQLFVQRRMAIMRFLNVTLPKALRKYIPDPSNEASQFFTDVVIKAMRSRENNPSPSSDFLQLLLDTKDKEGNRMLSDKSIIASSVLFLFAGSDTTTSQLTVASYCLATSPEIQQRLQQEVDEVVERHGGLTYDAIQEMPYLDRFISETLRLYAPASRIERESTREYTLSGTDIHIPVGTVVQMPVFSIHRDPDHYPDPLRFDPDRFLPEQKEKRHPCAYIPFGIGPRRCLSQRFALFEAKIALASLMLEMTFQPTPSTPPPPMPLAKGSFFLKPAGNKMPLIAVPRNKAN